jgi:hypothetical protein
LSDPAGLADVRNAAADDAEVRRGNQARAWIADCELRGVVARTPPQAGGGPLGQRCTFDLQAPSR